jgi:hypothetical protein
LITDTYGRIIILHVSADGKRANILEILQGIIWGESRTGEKQEFIGDGFAVVVSVNDPLIS